MRNKADTSVCLEVVRSFVSRINTVLKILIINSTSYPKITWEVLIEYI